MNACQYFYFFWEMPDGLLIFVSWCFFNIFEKYFSVQNRKPNDDTRHKKVKTIQCIDPTVGQCRIVRHPGHMLKTIILVFSPRTLLHDDYGCVVNGLHDRSQPTTKVMGLVDMDFRWVFKD